MSTSSTSRIVTDEEAILEVLASGHALTPGQIARRLTRVKPGAYARMVLITLYRMAREGQPIEHRASGSGTRWWLDRSCSPEKPGPATPTATATTEVLMVVHSTSEGLIATPAGGGVTAQLVGELAGSWRQIEVTP